ncbi:MAG: hypothetical protein NWS63_04760 [Saprospiraceae bacterium]|jgi:hypothetical protein|nr:hypothetical protein [Saprospiraceae bacterium]
MEDQQLFSSNSLEREVPSDDGAHCLKHPELSSEVLNPYGLGFYQGLIGSGEVFNEAFVKANAKKAEIIHLLRLCCEEMESLKAKIGGVKPKLGALRTSIVNHQEKRSYLEFKRQYTTEKVEYTKKLLEVVTATIEAIKPLHGLWMALLYLLVGAAFILVDFLVNRQIFLDILDMNMVESNFFAAGVALMSFMLKPAVDRVFEKNYPNDPKLVRRNHIMLLVLASLAIVALALMGLFRGMNFNLLGDFDANVFVAGKGILTIALFLLTVLFAVAGAITFSIGSPILRSYLTLLTYRTYRFRKRVALNRLMAKLHLFYKRISQHHAAVKIETDEVATLDKELELLEAALEQQHILERDLIAQYYEEDRKANSNIYQAGYENGQVHPLREELILKWKKRPWSRSAGYHQASNSKSNGVSSKGKYLHEQLRDQIRQKLNDLN